jgi:L-alanine-DL-glutamate epimerase-like enolase superfamily enzyme
MFSSKPVLDEPQFPQRSLERFRLAREALGPEVKLMMDAHGALTVDRAVRLGEAAREYELTWSEEPVLPDDDLPGPAEVRRRVPMPVATVESDTTRFAFRDILERRAADLLQPDVAVVGGLIRSTPRCGAGARAWAAGCTPRVGIGAAVGGQSAVGRADAQLRGLRVLPGLLSPFSMIC